MASMTDPELFLRGTKKLQKNNTAYILKKYKHFITWKNKPAIFEFGYADGSNSEKSLRPLLPHDYKEFVGSDISAQMIEFARKNVVLPRIDFIQLDIADKKVPANFKQRFDHVFSFFTIHRVENTRQAFTNVYNMLKPGGETFMIFFERAPMDAVFADLMKHPKWGKYPHKTMVSPYFFEKSPKECYIKAFKDCGFVDIKFEVEEIIDEFENLQAANDLALAINGVLPNIPAEEVEEYKKYYLEQIKKTIYVYDENKTGDKPKLRFNACVASARKP